MLRTHKARSGEPRRLRPQAIERPDPLGAIVGGTIGAAAGTVGGILGVEERPQFGVT